MPSQLAMDLATRLVRLATDRRLRIATAESCTGGLIGATLTDVPGASAVFTHGFITYANEAKRDVLGVPQSDLDHFGAVSDPVAKAMAVGARRVANADLSVSVTGIAGPGGGSAEKPVGLVYIATATAIRTQVHRHLFSKGSRSFIRLKTVEAALMHLLSEV